MSVLLVDVLVVIGFVVLALIALYGAVVILFGTGDVHDD